jgi:putative tryptophan/tyrosine transport system substrate-binding protein
VRDCDRFVAWVLRLLTAGYSPADLPVEPPTKFQVVLNMKAAQALGLTVSPSLLAQIDDVID